MNSHDLKNHILNKLLQRDVFIKRVSDIQYYTRCPYCGDSRSNPHTGHFYIRINPNDNFPIVYYCHKCPAEGIFSDETAELLGIELDQDIKADIKVMNKKSDKFSSYKNEIQNKYFEYKVPENYSYQKIKYVEDRLGITFTDDQLKDIKVITSLKDFLILNDIKKITCKPYMAKLVEQKYVGFLSNNNSYILFRDTTDSEEIRWFKYPITEESRGQRLFYSISSSINLYTDENIIINLSEGVFDTLSIAYNIEENRENILNIAICGKFYSAVIKYLLAMGFIGDNIIINIYSDKDYTNDTSMDFYRKTLKKYSYLVKEINVFYNVIGKDYGVKKEEIILQKEKL